MVQQLIDYFQLQFYLEKVLQRYPQVHIILVLLQMILMLIVGDLMGNLLNKKNHLIKK
jgi:hypothetical protein